MQFFKDKNVQITILQVPNNLLIGWFITMFFSSFLWEGPFEEVLTVISTLLLVAWSFEEMLNGDSPFRKTLGAIVFIVAMYKSF